MIYAVREHKPGFFLTGDYGTGKTLLSRALMKECPGDKFKFVIISNPRLTALDLIKEINHQLKGSARSSHEVSKADLLRSISDILEDNYNKGFYSVIIIDEAHSIEEDSILEEIRLLLNFQRDESILFTLLLLGQPPLLNRIERTPPLRQRLAIRYRLFPLNRHDTEEYVQHRLNVAGSNKKIFVDSSYDEIYAFSKGVPRVINNVCDLALLTGFIKKLNTVNADIILQVKSDLGDTVCSGEEEND